MRGFHWQEDVQCRLLLVVPALGSLSVAALAEEPAAKPQKSCSGLVNGHQIQACTEVCEKHRAGKN
jgi:hypothetical protein